MPRRPLLSRRTAGPLLAAGAAAVTGLALLTPAATAVTGTNPIGVLDSVSVRGSDGTVTISGWTADQDDPTDPLRVEIYDNGSYATAMIAQTPRPDVSASVPKIGPNHGFTVSYAGKTGVHQVCALALNHVGGSNTQLGCRSVRVNNDPVGLLEVSAQRPGGFLVSGYALDPNSPTSAVLIRTYLDGRYLNGRLATAARTDLPAQYAAGGPNHGFSFLTPMPVGTHQLCVYALNIGAGTVNPRLGCRTVTKVDNPVGALETSPQQPGGFLATGYALDLDTTSPIAVRIYLDGRYVATGPASAARPDLLTRYPAYGQNHGFAIFTPVPAGTHQLCAYGMNVGAGTVNTRFGCRTVTMNSNPLGVLESSPQQPGGFLATGYALDPDTTSPITVRVYLDGRYVANGLGLGRPSGRGDPLPRLRPEPRLRDLHPGHRRHPPAVRLRDERRQRHGQHPVRLPDGLADRRPGRLRSQHRAGRHHQHRRDLGLGARSRHRRPDQGADHQRRRGQAAADRQPGRDRLGRRLAALRQQPRLLGQPGAGRLRAPGLRERRQRRRGQGRLAGLPADHHLRLGLAGRSDRAGRLGRAASRPP